MSKMFQISNAFFSSTMAHKMITEPDFIVFELVPVVPVLRLPSKIVSGFNQSR